MPRAIGRYRLIRPLGSGGMGVVYLGEDPDLGRRVALKVIPTELATGAAFERFEREARTLAAIDHPCVATVYALEKSPAGPAMVMEYVAGQTLASRLASGPLGLVRAVAILRRVARALEAVHAKDVVHRDLKPANVMLLPDGRVKVLDFGLAVEARASDDTRTGAGTAGYMSPEQLRGEPVDGRADLFALAAITWECLTGTPAFPGETVVARVAATMTVRPDVRALPGDVPAAIRQVLERAFLPDVTMRPRSARVFLDAFASVPDESPTETRPAESVPVPVSRLPADTTSFVGRHAEKAALVEHLGASRLVTLTGVGGSGKTRLAVAAARGITPSDGVYFVELAPLGSPDQIVAALASALGAPELKGLSLEASLEAHVAALDALLVVDNCEHVLDAVAPMAGRLLHVAPQLRILATSREPLGVAGEVQFHVPPLSLPDAAAQRSDAAASDAVALFLERARRHRPDFAPGGERMAAVVEICRRVDGIPLAIELAAARLRVLTVEEIATRLGRRLRLLTSGDRAAPARHRTLRAAIDWSCDQLEPAERALLYRLSVFAGGFTLEAAEAVCAESPEEADLVLDELAALVQKSLVEAAPDGRETRYRLLECVHEYAGEKLDGLERERAARRHGDYFLELGTRAVERYHSPEWGVWLGRLGREYENIRAAVAVAEAAGDVARAVELALTLTRFWETRSRFVEGLALLGRLLVIYRGGKGDRLFARLLNDSGLLAYAHGDDRVARVRYKRALEVWSEIGDERPIAGCLNNTGLVVARAGDPEEAITYFDRAQALNRKIGNRAWESTNLLNRGFCYRDLGRFAEARRDLEAAIEILKELEDDVSLAAAYDNLGTLADDEKRYEEARELHERSLAINRRVENRRGVSINLGNLGCVELAVGNLDRARELLTESLVIRRELGVKLGIALALESFGSLAIGEEDWARAAVLIAAADALREVIDMPATRPDREAMDRGLAAVREAIGEEALQRAWALGRGTCEEDAVAYALGERELASGA